MKRLRQDVQVVAGRPVDREILELVRELTRRIDQARRQFHLAQQRFRQALVNAVVDVKLVVLAQLDLGQQRTARRHQCTTRFAHQHTVTPQTRLVEGVVNGIKIGRQRRRLVVLVQRRETAADIEIMYRYAGFLDDVERGVDAVDESLRCTTLRADMKCNAGLEIGVMHLAQQFRRGIGSDAELVG